ncbi:MAG: hypothetical protein CMI19_07280 [Opitutae bacterium]|nr:hypothetical protein [Opitutae bacterium]
MILTNVSAHQSQVEHVKAHDNFSKAARRLSSGIKLSSPAIDSGGLSQVKRMQTEKYLDQSYRLNLQNARSFLLTQQEGLQKVLKVYDRMETLCLRAMDTTITDAERKAYNDEFIGLVQNLEGLMSSKFQGRRLFNATLLCGGVKNIALGQLDLASGKPSGVSHAVRAESVDVHSSTGTISFRVNSGGAADIYRVWMGDVCVFSMGNPFQGTDHKQNYDDPGFSYAGGGWATSGSASGGDDDIVEVSFGPGKPTTYKIYLGDSNARPDGTMHKNQDVDDIDGDGNTTETIWDLRSNWQSTDTGTFTYDSDGDGVNDSPAPELTEDQRNALPGIPAWNSAARAANTDRSDYMNWANNWSNAQYEGDLSKKYGDPDAGYYSKIPNVIFTQDLPSGFENTDMTLQIETNTIGIIYAEGDAGIDGDSDNTGTPGIKFVPEHPDLELPVDHEGNILGIAAKSFGTLYSESPVFGDFHSLETAGKASDTLDHLRGNGDYYGEARCVIDDRLSAVASEINRLDRELEKLEERGIRNEAAIGKLVDADMANNATQLAKSKIRSDVAASCISKSMRINDALIPLTTNHHRGAILKG